MDLAAYSLQTNHHLFCAYLVLIVLDAFGPENNTAALALTPRAAQALHHANGRLLRVKAHNQIHFANVYEKNEQKNRKNILDKENPYFYPATLEHMHTHRIHINV